jgi:histidinol phosphatase-like PHP family hydrolase
MNIKYKLKKLCVWFNQKLNSCEPYTERENLTKRVLIRLISNPKTHYLMTPSGKYYIQTNDREYTLILQDNLVKVSNHNYTFEFNISSFLSNELIELVRKAIEKERSKMENEMFKNEINMLTDILSKK